MPSTLFLPVWDCLIKSLNRIQLMLMGSLLPGISLICKFLFTKKPGSSFHQVWDCTCCTAEVKRLGFYPSHSHKYNWSILELDNWTIFIVPITTYVPVVASHEHKSSNSQLYDTCTASHGYLTFLFYILVLANINSLAVLHKSQRQSASAS